MDHDRVRADLRASPTSIGPSSFAPEPDHDVVLDRRVALAAREARAAERDALVERHVVADLGRLADHDAGAVVDEERLADPRAPDGSPRRSGTRLALASACGTSGTPDLVQRVRDAVGEQRLHAAVGEQDLEPPDPARGGIALLRGRQVLRAARA